MSAKIVRKEDNEDEPIKVPKDESPDLVTKSLGDNKSSDEATGKPKITMGYKSMKIVATWKYTVDNDSCSLCRQDLMVPTQKSIREKQVNGNVTIGSCQHGFHEECINRWITEGNVSCPICKTTWKAAKHVGGDVYVYKSASK